MPKFDLLFPDAKYQDEPMMGIVMTKEPMGECSVCNELTLWIDIDFMTYICSTECEDKLTKEYMDALMDAVSK